MVGIAIAGFTMEIGLFKQVSHCVKNIFVYFKLCTWLLHTHRLYEASGFFQGELSRAPQAWHWEEEKV